MLRITIADDPALTHAIGRPGMNFTVQKVGEPTTKLTAEDKNTVHILARSASIAWDAFHSPVWEGAVQ